MVNDIPDNSEDIINGSDIEDRIDELEGERGTIADDIEDLQEAIDDPDEEAPDNAAGDIAAKRAELAAWDADNGAELATLKKLASEVEDYAGDGLRHSTLIRESHWQDYARDLVEDIGNLPKELPGYIVIDWQATADNLRADYTDVDFDGVTYLVR